MNAPRRLTLRRNPLTLLAVLVALLLSACASTPDDQATAPPSDATAESTDPDAGEASSDDGFPVVVDGIEIVERPQRIVSLAPAVTELLFAVGAGGQVIAVDEYSNFPEDAPVTELSGFQPNVEAIAAYDPDLVVVADSPGDVLESLAAIGIPALSLRTAIDLDDVYEQLGRLGVATGNVETADEAIADMRAEVDAILATIDTPDEPLTYYHELSSDFWSVSGETFIGAVYTTLGMTSIADAVEDGGAYPQLSPEFIIEADPDVILLASGSYGATPEEVADRPGWSTITAVRNGAVIEVDEDVASRWGPRIVQLMRDVAEALAELGVR